MALLSLSTSAAYRGLDATPFVFQGTACHLGKRTVIYGRNGSGKTTLAELLRDPTKLAVTASIRAAGRTSSVDASSLNVMVYNRFYVATSLSEFVDGSGGASPIGVRLGKANVALESEALSREEHADTLAERAKRILALKSELAATVERIEREVQYQIIAELKAGNPGHYTTQAFTVAPVKKLLNDTDQPVLGADDLTHQTAIANGAKAQELRWPPAPPSMLPSRPGEMLASCIGRPIDTVPIAALAANPSLAEWVDDGLKLHEVGDTCRFCGEGTITAELVAQYSKHFSEALEELRRDLGAAIQECDNHAPTYDRWLSGLPPASALSSELQAAYREAVDSALKNAALAQARIEKLAGAARERLADPFKPLSHPRSLGEPLPTIDVSRIVELLQRHNESAHSQEDAQADARRLVERHFAAERAGEYAALKRRIALADRAISELERVARQEVRNARRLRDSMLDTTHMATQLDADLKVHFGFGHLDIAASSDGKGYVVTRAGDRAKWLSEGERNAIAFAYFLRSLEGDNVNPATTIVVIDDPASSLDREALFAVSALAHQRTENFSQTIFLTHDFEFFRLLLNAYRSQRDSSRKKIRDHDAEETAFPKVQVLEMVSVVAQGNLRKSHLREFPDRLVRAKSEYHYLFEKVANAVADPSSAELPLLGNAARRLVEGFISFRGADGADFQTKVDGVVADSSVDKVLGERVVKFLHSQSHREEARPNAGLAFPSIDEELRNVLRFMRGADTRHFERMCKSVGQDLALLTSAIT